MVTTFSALCSRASFLQPVYLSAWHLGASTILVSTGLGGKGEGFPMCRVSWEHGVPTPQVPPPSPGSAMAEFRALCSSVQLLSQNLEEGSGFPLLRPKGQVTALDHQ